MREDVGRYCGIFTLDKFLSQKIGNKQIRNTSVQRLYAVEVSKPYPFHLEDA